MADSSGKKRKHWRKKPRVEDGDSTPYYLKVLMKQRAEAAAAKVKMENLAITTPIKENFATTKKNKKQTNVKRGSNKPPQEAVDSCQPIFLRGSLLTLIHCRETGRGLSRRSHYRADLFGSSFAASKLTNKPITCNDSSGEKDVYNVTYTPTSGCRLGNICNGFDCHPTLPLILISLTTNDHAYLFETTPAIEEEEPSFSCLGGSSFHNRVTQCLAPTHLQHQSKSLFQNNSRICLTSSEKCVIAAIGFVGECNVVGCVALYSFPISEMANRPPLLNAAKVFDLQAPGTLYAFQIKTYSIDSSFSSSFSLNKHEKNEKQKRKNNINISVLLGGDKQLSSYSFPESLLLNGNRSNIVHDLFHTPTDVFSMNLVPFTWRSYWKFRTSKPLNHSKSSSSSSFLISNHEIPPILIGSRDGTVRLIGGNYTAPSASSHHRGKKKYKEMHQQNILRSQPMSPVIRIEPLNSSEHLVVTCDWNGTIKIINISNMNLIHCLRDLRGLNGGGMLSRMSPSSSASPSSLLANGMMPCVDTIAGTVAWITSEQGCWGLKIVNAVSGRVLCEFHSKEHVNFLPFLVRTPQRPPYDENRPLCEWWSRCWSLLHHNQNECLVWFSKFHWRI